MLALPVFANETEERKTATSLSYVTHELDTRQNKLSAGTDAALTYTNAAGGVQQRTVKGNLNGGTTDTSLPTVNAVNTGLNAKQDDIEAINDHTAVTYTENVGEIGTKGIYQATGTYVEQSDNLIDAKTFNAALKNALDNEFVCADRPDAHAPGTNTCWLWEIHNGTGSYVSATGTVTQDGTPTPTNPIDPVFFQQGDMVLRKVGNYADSYDATTHKITRRVGEKVFDGTETWVQNTEYNRFVWFSNDMIDAVARSLTLYCTHYIGIRASTLDYGYIYNGNNRALMITDSAADVTAWKQFLAQQYAAGTPVTVWYPLAEPVEENWSATRYNENVYIPQNQ